MEYQTKFSSKEKPRIEYILLHDTVESITFPKWTEMNVSWRCGLSSKVEIDYEKPADHPYPTITCEEYVHQRRRLKPYVTLTYMVNGIPLIKGCPKRQIGGIQRAQDEIQELIVLEPLGYEPDVPRVFGERTCSKRFEAESSRGEKRP